MPLQDNTGDDVDTKRLSNVEVKDEDEGRVEAVFATFNVIDSDGDVTVPEAFEDGHPVRISSFNHGSWTSGQLPVGKGVVRVREDAAVLEGEFFDTQVGRDHFETVKALDDLGEWSYSLDGVVREPGEFDGEQVHFIKQVSPTEVSPVIRGAGVNTRTLSAKSKSMSFTDHADSVHTEVRQLFDRAEEIVKLRRRDGKSISDDSLSQLEDVVQEATKRLKALQGGNDDHNDVLADEYARFIQATRGV